VIAQGGSKAVWKHGNPVLEAFAITHEDLTLLKIYVLHSQSKAFHQSQTASIEEIGFQLLNSSRATKDLAHLFFG
jgi:hypothetical protein